MYFFFLFCGLASPFCVCRCVDQMCSAVMAEINQKVIQLNKEVMSQGKYAKLKKTVLCVSVI